MLPDILVSQGVTFEKRRPGQYISSTSVLGGLTNEIRFTPNSTSKKGGLSFSMTRVTGFAVTAPGTTIPKISNGVWTLSYNGPLAVSPTVGDIVNNVNDFATVLTASIIKMLLQGAN